MIWKFTWVGLIIWSFYTYFVDIITYLIVTIRPIKMEVLGSIHPHGSIQENTGNIDLENDSWKIAALDVPCRVLSVICGLLCKELANIKGQWIQPCPSPKKGRGQPWLILDAVQKSLFRRVPSGTMWQEQLGFPGQEMEHITPRPTFEDRNRGHVASPNFAENRAWRRIRMVSNPFEPHLSYQKIGSEWRVWPPPILISVVL